MELASNSLKIMVDQEHFCSLMPLAFTHLEGLISIFFMNVILGCIYDEISGNERLYARTIWLPPPSLPNRFLPSDIRAETYICVIRAKCNTYQ